MKHDKTSSIAVLLGSISGLIHINFNPLYHQPLRCTMTTRKSKKFHPMDAFKKAKSFADEAMLIYDNQVFYLIIQFAADVASKVESTSEQCRVMCRSVKQLVIVSALKRTTREPKLQTYCLVLATRHSNGTGTETNFYQCKSSWEGHTALISDTSKCIHPLF